jgi:speckle-type POZ protein
MTLGYRMDEEKYDLQIVDFALPSTDKPLTKKLFLDKTFTDFKIKCQGKIYECHRCVLGSQSNVFQAMFLNMDMKEGASGEVEIKDVTAETMDMLLYYFYHEELEDTKLVDTNLLFAAEKYYVPGLLKLCVQHLKASLSIDNVLDILLCAHLTNQEGLFNTASNFVMKNKGKLIKTMEWTEMMETNPKLIATVLSNVLGVQ